jgi:hypothetical protein
VQDTLEFIPDWKLTLGVRRDIMRSEYFTNTAFSGNFSENSYRAGLSAADSRRSTTTPGGAIRSARRPTSISCPAASIRPSAPRSSNWAASGCWPMAIFPAHLVVSRHQGLGAIPT